MARVRLTVDQAKQLDFDELSKRAYGLLEPYEAAEIETESERDDRIGRTLDQLPDIYAWLLQLHAYFDHWAEFWMSQSRTAMEYKEMRVKRDLMENVAKAAKTRYEGTSRRLTHLQNHEAEARMPRGRR